MKKIRYIIPLLLSMIFMGASGYQSTSAITISIADRYVQIGWAIHIFIDTDNTDTITLYSRDPKGANTWEVVGTVTAQDHFTISTTSMTAMDREYQARTDTINSNVLKVFWRAKEDIPNVDLQKELLERMGRNFAVFGLSLAITGTIFFVLMRTGGNPLPWSLAAFYFSFIGWGIFLEAHVLTWVILGLVTLGGLAITATIRRR